MGHVTSDSYWVKRDVSHFYPSCQKAPAMAGYEWHNACRVSSPRKREKSCE